MLQLSLKRIKMITYFENPTIELHILYFIVKCQLTNTLECLTNANLA